MNPKPFAEALRKAHQDKIAIPPLRDKIGMDIDLAYEIQKLNTLNKLENGARIIGKKIGLTSFAVQKQLGVNQPDFGVLFEDMEVLNGQSIGMGELMQAKVEAEIAFVLGDDLDISQMTILDVISAIDYAVPSIEIVGSRIENWNIKISDTIADNASASHYVIGHTPKTLDEFDLVNCRMQMTKNNEVVSEGTGRACLGSPLNATLWLAKKMYAMGVPLQAGELILSGALGPMAPVEEGDVFKASFEGLGTVSVGFE